MRLKQEFSCDVLVLGSGIAGISAALQAAENGSQVALCCKGKLFSGSSFYPGTWGLGLIGPAGPEDQVDLEETICHVGCGMADPKMVRTFVENIHPAIARVRSMGIKLRRASKGTQKEFIPCFDHKHRDWNGIEFDSARDVFSRELQQRQVKILPEYEALQLVKAEGTVCGAVLYGEKRLHYVACKAVVLATGGYGSLFRYHLCTEDVEGIGQYLALEAGCSLVNMEFMQMMPGYITPASKTIFNEKAFRFARMQRSDGTPLLSAKESWLLEQRSTHGPFTSRLDSKDVDIAMFREFQQHPQGVKVTYDRKMIASPPEFIQVYFDWLKEAKGVSMKDPIWVGIFAHAANGGIQIAPDASTEVPGLYAAGEVTGGMHGADRIGGLSTANGLVFGTIAGQSAARFPGVPAPSYVDFENVASPDCDHLLGTLQDTMFRNAMVLRSAAGLTAARACIQSIREQMGKYPYVSTDAEAIAQTRRLLARCATAESILAAATLRTESRGSHYRTDFPARDDRFQRRILVTMDSKGVHCGYEKEVQSL